MRIISKFRDYYDSCQNPADTFVWIRERQQIELKTYSGSKGVVDQLYQAYRHKWTWNTSEAYARHYIVGFCGRIYPMIILEKPGVGDFYSPAKTTFEFLFESPSQSRSKRRRTRERQFFDIGKDFSGYLTGIFSKYKVPYYWISNSYPKAYQGWDLTLELNPQLSDFQWYRKFNTQQCYQEIEMYLLNDLVDDAVDKVKIDSEFRKGARFDKYSFRRLPEKKR